MRFLLVGTRYSDCFSSLIPQEPSYELDASQYCNLGQWYFNIIVVVQFPLVVSFGETLHSSLNACTTCNRKEF